MTIPELETEGEEEPQTEPSIAIPTSWEWFDAPSTEEVIDKLKTLPPVWGIEMWKYVEYVQPLSQSKNVAIPKAGEKSDQKDYRIVWNLYFTVAGRVRMLNDAAEEQGWLVDFKPERRVPKGNAAGYLHFDGPDVEGGRIVYREYVVIGEKPNRLGRRPGTAWVPASGGAMAVASNRFEVVETSARGRALAAWGFGVLPGSGIASLDEMIAMQGMTGGRPVRREKKETTQKPRADTESELRTVIEAYRQSEGLTDVDVLERVSSFVSRSFAKEVKPDEAGRIDLTGLKPGELMLLKNRLTMAIERNEGDDNARRTSEAGGKERDAGRPFTDSD